jgi:ABC-2 type transport system ATP-binding protein
MLAVETHNLSRSYKKVFAVQDLNLQIPMGSVFGFLGPNGAGKTTTVRMLSALIEPSSGSAQILGHRLGQEDNEIRRKVGILTEIPGLYDELSVLENLIFFGQLYGLSKPQAKARAQHYLQMLGLWERRNTNVTKLSRGMRQKLAIARAIQHEPKLIFLDEPTVGLDPEASLIIRNFINELRSNGRTIFLTTHHLQDAQALCDQIAFFQGRILAQGTIKELLQEHYGQRIRITLQGPAETWIEALAKLDFIENIEAQAQQLVIRLKQPEQNNQHLIRRLIEHNAPIIYVEELPGSLEDLYLKTIEGAKS